jgi:hypothetical protein
VFVAVEADALGLSVGFESGAALSAVLDAPAPAKPPVLAMRMDGAFAMQLSQMAGDDEDYSDMQALSPEAVEALRELDRSEYQDVEWMTFSFDVTEHGLVGRGDVRYKPPR